LRRDPSRVGLEVPRLLTFLFFMLQPQDLVLRLLK
jgi:hypothetical protein